MKEPDLKQLMAWMFEEDESGRTKIVESRNLKLLDRIVASKPALKALKSGYSIFQADQLSGAPKEVFQNALHSSRRELETARNQMHLFQDPDPSDADILEDIDKLVRLLRDWVDKKLGELTRA